MATPYCYFQKRIVPLEEAKVGVMTHAFLYGTAFLHSAPVLAWLIWNQWQRGSLEVFTPLPAPIR